MSRWFLVPAVLLGVSIALPATERPVSRDAYATPDRQFVVQTDTRLSDEEAHRSASQAAHAWTFLQHTMRWPRLEPLADTVYLQVVDKAMLGGRPVLGLATGGTGIVIGYHHALTPDSAATMAHELLHIQDTRELNGRTIPPYFSEGRATSIGFAYLRHLKLRDTQDWRRRLMRWNAETAMEVLTGRAKVHSVENEEIGTLFVDQLIHRYTDFFPLSAQVVDRVAQGADFADAFDNVFELSLDQAKADFLRFIKATQNDPAARLRGTSFISR